MNIYERYAYQHNLKNRFANYGDTEDETIDNYIKSRMEIRQKYVNPEPELDMAKITDQVRTTLEKALSKITA